MGFKLDRRLRGIVVHDLELYGKSGSVGRWFRALGREFEANAKAQAPVNKRPKGPGKRAPGALKESIRVKTTRVGPRTLRNELTIGVSYASFVVRGTQGPIFARHGRSMKIYHAQLDLPIRVRTNRSTGETTSSIYWNFYAVDGQRRNAFLDRASRITAARHPSMTGLRRIKIGV